MKNRLSAGLFLLFCLLAGGCANQAAIRDEFDKSTKAYNRMLRWQEIEQAGMLYQEPGLRDRFMAAAESMKKRRVTITDYRILTAEFLPEKENGTVAAEFDYYILPSNRIKTLTYRQDWAYREIGKVKAWRVNSPLPPFE